MARSQAGREPGAGGGGLDAQRERVIGVLAAQSREERLGAGGVSRGAGAQAGLEERPGGGVGPALLAGKVEHLLPAALQVAGEPLPQRPVVGGVLGRAVVA